MSLFKARVFWSTECDVDEKFDQNSMVTSKLNSSSTDHVLIGSHSGILRIFNTGNELQEGVISGYQPTDLLMEKIFPFPILQLGTGRLVSGSKLVQIAILHPRSLGIYNLISKEGLTKHGAQNSLQMMYEHKLKRSAYSLTIGLFGGSQSRDFMCVQSLDGMLTFYEQETFVFCCFLPNFLLPGPLVYVKRADSFVTVGSGWTIDSFRYKLLSDAGQNTDQDGASGKKIDSDWSFNLGEGAIDIQVVEDENTKESYVAVLGERNYYCLTQNGKLKFMKKLDYPASCFHLYSLENKIMSLIVSVTDTLLIYQDTTLKWSAQLHITPIAIGRAFLKNITGAIVLLAQDGIIQMCYLGTEPCLFAAPPLVNQELDFEKAEQELMTLNKMIKTSYNNDVKLTNENAERELVLIISVNPHLETEGDTKICEVLVEVLPQALFEEVQIALSVPKPLHVTPKTMWYNNLKDRAKFFSYVKVDGKLEVPSLEFEARASFVTSLGVPRVTVKTTNLPLNLVVETCPPVKDSEHKITLNINNSIVPLSSLFPEFAGENTLNVNSNAIGFRGLSGVGKTVTLLIAKSSQRYRLQSDSILSANLLVQEMVRRLNKYYATMPEFAVTIGSTLPTQPILEYVKKHHEARQSTSKLQNELDQLGAQYRLIQKRLITKFKDKNPSPLTKLEILLTDTYEEISTITNQYQQAFETLLQSQIHLSCALSLLLNLAKLNSGSSDTTLLESAFSPLVYDLDTQNWEDVMDASLCFLLRTALAKSEKDKLRAPHAAYEEIKDIGKLEKHFTAALERISKKGVGLEAPQIAENDCSETVGNPDGKQLMPIGSQIGESSSRAISAKKGGTRKRDRPQDT